MKDKDREMQVIGHRGASALAPENTLEGFEVALSLGVDAIETDVQATSDGELVLIHDERLGRTTNGEGLVCDAPLDVIKELDAGSWFGEGYRGARVPLLRDTLERYGQRVHLVLEVKVPGTEHQVLAVVREMGLLGDVTFTSFSFEIAERIKATAPEAKVGWLTSEIGDSAVTRALDARLEQFCPPAEAVTPELVEKWKTLGLEIRVWGVTDAEVMMQAVEAGVDGMTVDFPHLLLQALGRL